jgi:hypothetical protein
MLFTYALTIAQLVKNACTPRVKRMASIVDEISCSSGNTSDGKTVAIDQTQFDPSALTKDPAMHPSDASNDLLQFLQANLAKLRRSGNTPLCMRQRQQFRQHRNFSAK